MTCGRMGPSAMGSVEAEVTLTQYSRVCQGSARSQGPSWSFYCDGYKKCLMILSLGMTG